MTDSDWGGLLELVIAVLAASDAEILAEARLVTGEWEDKPEGLEWDDEIGRKDGQIWIPESDDLWRKILGLYHDSPVTGHLGMLGTLEIVSRSYWHCNLANWVKCYVHGCHTCH
jgi:hypothetical protein